MKRIEVISPIMILVALILSATAVNGKEVVEKSIVKKAFVSQNALLDIANKFGDVQMTAYDGDEVQLEITVRLEARNEEKGKELLESVKLDYRATSDEVFAHIKATGNNYQNLEIDWKVKFPRTNRLQVKVNYGDLTLNEANAATDIAVAYGKAVLGNLRNKTNKVSIQYGSGTLESANYLDLRLRYSEMDYLGKVKLLNLDAMYSEANLISIGRLNLKSGYDEFEITAVAELNAECDYSELEIGAITMKLNADLDFGELEVKKISKEFKSVKLTSSYTDSELTFEAGSSLILNADASYGEINVHGREVVKTVKTTSESLHESGESGGSPVDIRISFGEVELSFE
jgi:hypothetical protein